MAENLGAKFTIDVSDLKKGLQQANRLIRESESEFKASAASMDNWKTNADGLNANLKKLNTVADIQSEKVKALKENYNNLIKAGLDPTSSKATLLRTEINNATAAFNKSQTEIADTEKALKKLGDESNNSKNRLNEVDDAASNLKGGFSIAKGAIANFISSGLQAATSAIKGLVGEAVSASDSLYKFEQTMGFAGFDSSAIDEAKTKMKQYADQTVYDLGTVANTTAQLAANGIKDYTGLTQAAGNLNAVAGGNADTFGSVAMVLTQTAGAGKLTTENWNQLADAIPGASGKLQEALLSAGAYTGNFRDAMSKGQITAEEFNAAILQLGNEPVAVEAATSVSTFEGAIGNMQAAVVDGLMKIINAIGMENITAFISSIANGATKAAEKINEFANSQSWSTIKQAISDAFSWLKDEALPAIKTGIEWGIDNLPTVATAIGGITAAMVAFKISTLAAAAAEKEMTLAQYASATAQNLLNSTMLANPISLVIMAITALVAAFIYLWNNCESFRQFWINLWDTITNFCSNAWQNITGFFSAAWQNILTIWSAVSGFFSGVWEAIKTIFAPVADFFNTLFGNAFTLVKDIWILASFFFQTVWDAIKAIFEPVINFFSDLFSGAWDAIKSVWDTVSGYFAAIVDGIQSIFSPVINFFRNVFSDAWNAIKNVFNSVGSFFNGIWNTIKGIFTNIGQKAGDAIGGAFKSAINAVLSTVENVLNTPINAINSLLGTINKVPGINLSKLDTFSLPRLAKGGVVKGATLAEIGEAGAEAIVPLENNTEWIRKVARQLKAETIALNNNSGSNGNNTVVDGGKSVTINQNNYYSAAHSRYELYKSKQDTAAAVKLALMNS